MHLIGSGCMFVIVDGKELINLDELETLNPGQDGELFIYGNDVIKICNSGYMSYEKLEDYNKLATSLTGKKHLILPEKTVEQFNVFVKKMVITPLFGYTQKYILRKKDGIGSLKTNTFISNMKQLHDDIHEVFSKNSIGLMDTNPENLIVDQNDEIFLVDHDRNVTPSCMSSEKRDIHGDYLLHNDKRFSILLNRCITDKIVKKYGNNPNNLKKLLSVMTENSPCEEIYSQLSDYDTFDDFIKGKAKQLKIK